MAGLRQEVMRGRTHTHTHIVLSETLFLSLCTLHINSLDQRAFLMDVLPLSTGFLYELKVLRALMPRQNGSVISQHLAALKRHHLTFNFFFHKYPVQ